MGSRLHCWCLRALCAMLTGFVERNDGLFFVGGALALVCALLVSCREEVEGGE